MSICRISRLVLLSSLLCLLPVACGDDNGGGSTGPTPTGSLEVTLTIAGDALDADGCVFTVDGASSRRLTAGESTTYSGLTVGQHEVAISDVAGNCQVLGEAIRSVSVTDGQTATVTYAVTCAQDVGAIEVSVTTSGEELDADGYEVVVDGGAPAAIGINGSMTAGNLTPGDHTVALQGVASNCSVGGGGNPRTVAVTAGQTATSAFTVTCSSTSGSMAISAATTGEDQDEDGYEVTVDGGAPSAIGINGSLTAGGLSPGDHTVELQGEAFNCDVGGNNPRQVTVTAGAEVQLTFDVTCRYHLYDRVAFQSHRTGTWMLYAADPSGAAAVRALGLQGMHPAVSPDGLRIAYERSPDIWVAWADGSSPASITGSDFGERPAWSPDGSRIAYERLGRLWVMQADGSNRTDLGVDGGQPTWSPDGLRIAFTHANDIRIVNADGSGETALTTDPAGDHSPAWSPLGNLISFTSDRDGSWHIFVKDPAGGPATNMTIGIIGTAEHSTWAPDAVAGAFHSDFFGDLEVFAFIPGVTGLLGLTLHPSADLFPSWGGGN